MTPQPIHEDELQAWADRRLPAEHRRAQPAGHLARLRQQHRPAQGPGRGLRATAQAILGLITTNRERLGTHAPSQEPTRA